MMVVASGRKEHGVPAVPGRDFEPEHVAIKPQSAVQVRHGEVDMTDSSSGINGHH